MLKKIAIQLVIAGALFVPWLMIDYFNLISPLVIPPVGQTVASFFEFFSSWLIMVDLLNTVYKTFAGLGMGLILGLPLGIFLGSSEKIYKYLSFWIDWLRSIPPPALIPLFLLLFGMGDISKIALSAFLSTLIITVNTVYGIANANKNRILFAQTMKMSKFSLFTKVVFFDALPHISGGVRLAISLCLIVVIVGEMLIGTDAGLGKKIIDYHLTYEIPSMYAMIFLTGLVGYFINSTYLIFEKKYIHWQGR